MNYYEHHLGDYDGATAHLSWLEDCAYRRLMCLYYRNEGPVPVDIKQACRLVRASSKPERDAVQQVLSEFFDLQADGWHHKRCDEEVARFKAKSQKARDSVSKRWSNRDATAVPTHNERNTNVDTNVLPTHNEGNTPRARPQTPDTRHQPSSKATGVARGTRLPPDWSPDRDGLEFAESQGLRNGRASAELGKFRDYWTAQPGQKGVKTDWSATWRNWVRRAVENPSKAGASDDIFAGSL